MIKNRAKLTQRQGSLKKYRLAYQRIGFHIAKFRGFEAHRCDHHRSSMIKR
jgi:hypothetical protein